MSSTTSLDASLLAQSQAMRLQGASVLTLLAATAQVQAGRLGMVSDTVSLSAEGIAALASEQAAAAAASAQALMSGVNPS